MAMTEKINPTAKLNRRFVNLGGGLSIILAIAAIAIIAVGVFGDRSQPVDILAMGALWITFYAGVIIVGSSFLRGNRKALWALLGFWLLTTLGAVLVAFGWLIWDIEILPEGIRTAGVWFLIVQFLGVAPTAALLAATPPATRNRYGAMVGVSVAAAVAVVVVVNMFAAAHPIRKDCETLNRFGLSEYAKKIIADVDSPMTISAVYAAAAGDADTKEKLAVKTRTQNQLRRVMELLEEIHRANPKITVNDASSDAARARLTARLQKRQLAKTGPQQQLLQKILDALPEIKARITQAQTPWTQLPANSYLSQWNVGPKTADMLKLCSQEITNAERAVRQTKATSPLPDHAKMLDKIVAALKNCQNALGANIKLQKRLAAIPPAVKANAPDAIKSVSAATDAVNALVKILDDGSGATADPAATLQKLIDALNQTGGKVHAARGRLDLLAGKDPENVTLLLRSKAWRIVVPTQLGNISITRSELLDNIAREIENRRAQCAMLLQNANTQAQSKFLVDIRAEFARLAKVMADNSTAVKTGIKQFQTIDPASENLLNLAGSGNLFGNLIPLINPMLDEAGKLKPPADNSMPPDLTGQNIIVIETDPKVEVVPFPAVWPYRMSNVSAGRQEESRRFFNGDAAISSRVLGLNHAKPFARVVITYLQVPPPKGMNPRMYNPQPGDMPPNQLQYLGLRLAEANFQLLPWNLDDPIPAGICREKEKTPDTDSPDDIATVKPVEEDKTAGKPPLPTVLLILPPPPPVIAPGGGATHGKLLPGHIAKIREAIDNGATAIFAAKCLMPRPGQWGQSIPQEYRLNEYLKEDWGIDVKTSDMVIEGIPGRKVGMYRLDPMKLQYMPVNSFTAQPIGKPLRGRHMFWPLICPITYQPKNKAPAGVSVEPILRIPDTQTQIWATKNIYKLVAEAESSADNLVSPHYDKGDMRVPLTLALAATRGKTTDKNGKQSRSPARIVVMGLGGGLMDWYVEKPIQNLEGGYTTQDPPRANLDLIVNSAYWLVGLEDKIATGPLSIEPVEEMSKEKQTIIWILCVIGLPLVVLAAGGAVMLKRRK